MLLVEGMQCLSLLPVAWTRGILTFSSRVVDSSSESRRTSEEFAKQRRDDPEEGQTVESVVSVYQSASLLSATLDSSYLPLVLPLLPSKHRSNRSNHTTRDTTSLSATLTIAHRASVVDLSLNTASSSRLACPFLSPLPCLPSLRDGQGLLRHPRRGSRR